MGKTKAEQQAIKEKVKLIHDGVITDSAIATAERMGVSIERYMSWGVSSRGEYELGLWTYYINSRTPERLAEIREQKRERDRLRREKKKKEKRALIDDTWYVEDSIGTHIVNFSKTK